MKTGVLCYDKNDNLIMASAGADINEGDIVSVKGIDQDYIVRSAGSVMHMMCGSNRIVELEKYKESKRKVS